ncbi:MAG: hypothetical protein AAGD22_09285 [Verrucomicrobiota bacterium]
MKVGIFILMGVFGGLGCCFGQSTSSSLTYDLLHAPAGDIGGGGVATSNGGTVVAQVSTGDPASGVVTSGGTASGFEAKGNLVGQLFDVTGVSVAAAGGTTVNEEGTRQLTATATLDDSTTLDLTQATGAMWAFTPPPISGVNISTGVATAGNVYEDTATQVAVTFQGGTGVVDLTVLNVGSDDYELYAGDGVDDDWQVLFFGEGNADGVGTANPDGDPDDNEGEFLGGFDPTDGSDFFVLSADGFDGVSTLNLRLNKVIPGRTYTVRKSVDLGTSTPFAPVGSSFSVGSEEVDRLFVDPGASGRNSFYEVEISRP